MNPVQEVSTVPFPRQSLLLLHTKPVDASPHVVCSIQQLFEDKVLDRGSDEFAFVCHYLSELMGPMILCGIDKLGEGLDKFGDTIREFLIPISQLTDTQMLDAVTELEERRAWCLYLIHQPLAPQPTIDYRWEYKP
jgi:hypothetical protein